MFSHSDQASQWQTSVPNGLGATGWGGRLADSVQSFNTGAQFPTVTSIQGCALFCTGKNTLPNGNDGSDHAWGNHHFIIGTGVKGGAMYGAYPSLAFGSPNDTNMRGTIIPTTSVDQYGATLATWFGVPGSSLSTIFPNSVNFPASSLNVGFLG